MDGLQCSRTVIKSEGCNSVFGVFLGTINGFKPKIVSLLREVGTIILCTLLPCTELVVENRVMTFVELQTLQQVFISDVWKHFGSLVPRNPNTAEILLVSCRCLQIIHAESF